MLILHTAVAVGVPGFVAFRTAAPAKDRPILRPADFYQGELMNPYARKIHNHMVDGRAYGFPFDDVGGFAAYVHDDAPTQCTLELTPF